MFSEDVLLLRADYHRKRQASNLFPPAGRPILEAEIVPGDPPSARYWFGKDSSSGTPDGYVQLFDIPGTLSGDIIRLERGLPPTLPANCEIEGDTIRPLDRWPDLPRTFGEEDDDFEDIQDVVAELPLVEVDPSAHFVKKGKYQSEIANLLACQGGSCSSTVRSEHVVRLLGRSSDGELVFEKLSRPRPILARTSSLAVYKTWLLHLVNALAYLHALGIVHQDLHIDNCIFAEDGQRLVVCDLESHWGLRDAPEVAFAGGLTESGWTARSDIYDIGSCIKCMIYANVPITNQVEWPVPPPLQAIVDACMGRVPDERPTLLELRQMVEGLPDDNGSVS